MDNIENLIPHRGRMKLIDEIIEVTEDSASTKARVLDNWPLSNVGKVDIMVSIELMAQTMAVWEGWNQRNKEKIEGLGVIAGIKKALFAKPYLVPGNNVTVSIKRLYKLDTFAIFEGRVKVDEQVYAQAEMQVYRIVDPTVLSLKE